MNWFPVMPIINYTASIIYLILFILVILRNPGGKPDRFAAALFLCFALWSICKTLLSNSGTPENSVVFFSGLSAIGVAFFPLLSFWFFVTLSGRKKPDGSARNIAVSFAFPVFFLALNWAGLLTQAPEKRSFGWVSEWIQGSPYPWLFYIYCLGAVLAGLFYYANFRDAVTKGLRKKQAITLYISTAASITIAAVFDIILPMFGAGAGIYSDMSNVYLLILAAGIFFALTKYNFLALTPVTAADSIITGMNEFLMLLDEDLKISFMNKTGLDLTGYMDYEVRNKPFSMFLADKNCSSRIIKEVIREGFYKNDGFSLLGRDGRVIPVIFSAAIIREMGEMRGIACVASDISSLKNTQEELKKSYDRLQELSSQKEEFTSFVSHELRTPLTSINGFISILLKDAGGTLDNTQFEFLNIIRNNSDRLLKLLNDLLDSSKMESGKFTISKSPCLLTNIIKSGVKELGSLIEKNSVAVSMELEPQEDGFMADSGRIHQVLVNILNNAIKYSPQGSSIKICLKFMPFESIDMPPVVDRKKLKNCAYAVISLADNGPGLPLEHLNDIFEKYRRIENNGRTKPDGTGLGLTIVKHIVELHGGAVWAESEGPQKGSKFTFILPSL